MKRLSASRYAYIGAAYGGVIGGLYWLHSAWAAIVIYHLLAVWGVYCAGDRGWFNEIGKGFKGYPGFVYITASILIGPLIVLLWPYMKLNQMTLGRLLGSYGLSGVGWYIFIGYFTVIHPVIEEVFWRRFLASKRQMIAWQDFAFGGYHIFVLVLFIKPPWVLLAFVLLSIVSWAWRKAAISCKGLAVPVLAHMAGCGSVIAAVHWVW